MGVANKIGLTVYIYIYIYIYLNVKVIFEGKKIATLEGFTAQGSNWYQNCTIPHLIYFISEARKNSWFPTKREKPVKKGQNHANFHSAS